MKKTIGMAAMVSMLMGLILVVSIVPAVADAASDVRILADVSYGPDDLQKMDIYLPPQATDVPVVLMVHGGAWRFGDKTSDAVVENKVEWLVKQQGYIFISVNYRLSTDPLEQANDIARALAFAQKRIRWFGGDPSRFVLMGHSAGAHLVAVLAAAPDIAYRLGARPWRGTVAIDSAAYDVVLIMGEDHLPLYDRAFGDDPAYWESASPYHLLTAPRQPLLAICSTRRQDSYYQADRFTDKATSLGMVAEILEVDLSHRKANVELGRDVDYTKAVQDFLTMVCEMQ